MSEPHSEQGTNDHDSPWKEALDHYFPDFLALLFPDAYAGTDWSRGYHARDTELQQVVRDATSGRRHADKLVEVYAEDGTPAWVLVHVEVQGEAEAGFAERMYRYHYRIGDRYAVEVVSLAVLADERPGFRPQTFETVRWGCALYFRFPVVKLLDWAEEAGVATLEASENRFAPVVLAQIQAKAVKDVDARAAWKFRLVRRLYERGHGREVILELFRVIDWMIQLPEAAEARFRAQLYEFEEAQKMPYVTTVERAGIEKGLQQGMQQGMQQGEAAVLRRLLERRFGADAVAAHRARIEHADAETLLVWSERVLTAETPEAVFTTKDRG